MLLLSVPVGEQVGIDVQLECRLAVGHIKVSGSSTTSYLSSGYTSFVSP